MSERDISPDDLAAFDGLFPGVTALLRRLREERAVGWDEGFKVGVKVGTGRGYAEANFSDDNPYRKP